jgi:phosphoribosylanthranilate isomerase
MIRVKICGLTNFADASAAIEAGADLLGFNFHPPSPRYVTPVAAAGIIARLRARYGATADASFLCVGVFVNLTPAEMRTIQHQCGLDLLQLSGDEPPESLDALGPDAFKALRPRTPSEARHSTAWYDGAGRCSEPRFQLDTSHPELYGGSGMTGDWAIAQSIAERYPILLAGGLSPTNVGEAVRRVRPWGVDVASGVERAPGLKDAAKMTAFICGAREAA